MQRLASHRYGIALLALLALAALLFACGLPGGFVLDDYANLQGLERIAGSRLNAALFLANVPSAFPGRPLSYLSFVAQYASWPGDPAAFKMVNIAIHLATGALLFALVRRATSMAGAPGPAPIALIAAAIWLLHPLQVSTVLYVVQRMAQLATLISLLAVLAYLKGRKLGSAGFERRAYAWMTGAVVLGGPIAVLAKENGALLPVLIGVLELTLLARLRRPRRWGVWASIFLAAPCVVLFVYLVTGPASPSAYATRNFDMAQRLYTEAGILWEYVGKILFPRPLALGIYFDDYAVSAPPWASLATALQIAGWLAAIAVAVALRTRLPFVSFGVLWFLGGHLLESTIVPLELYFDHRNYLPLAGPAVAVAWLAHALWRRASSATTRRIYASLALAGLLALSAVTWVEARTWSDPIRQTVLWAREHPRSMRAQYELASAYMNARRYEEAEKTLDQMSELSPQDGQILLNRIFLGCYADSPALPPSPAAKAMLEHSPIHPGMASLLDSIVEMIEEGRCPRVGTRYARDLADGLLSNREVGGKFRRVVLTQRARLYAVEGNLDAAVRGLEAADAIGPSLASVQMQAIWLVSADLYDDALRAIEKARQDPRWQPWQKKLYPDLFDRWEKQVRQAAQDRGGRAGR